MAETLRWPVLPGEKEEKPSDQKNNFLFKAFRAIFGARAVKIPKGLSGELVVARELDRLPDGWFIINDTVVGGSQVDHLVISPKGIHCLETKNWNNAGCDENGVWSRFYLGQWVPLVESPAEQNINHIKSLKAFINDRLGMNISVTSYVVLANPGCRLNIKARIIPPGNTVICLPSELCRLLPDSGPEILSPGEVQKIALALAGASK